MDLGPVSSGKKKKKKKMCPRNIPVHVGYDSSD